MESKGKQGILGAVVAIVSAVQAALAAQGVDVNDWLAAALWFVVLVAAWGLITRNVKRRAPRVALGCVALVAAVAAFVFIRRPKTPEAKAVISGHAPAKVLVNNEARSITVEFPLVNTGTAATAGTVIGVLVRNGDGLAANAGTVTRTTIDLPATGKPMRAYRMTYEANNNPTFTEVIHGDRHVVCGLTHIISEQRTSERDKTMASIIATIDRLKARR